jgi:hypothetical protein
MHGDGSGGGTGGRGAGSAGGGSGGSGDGSGGGGSGGGGSSGGSSGERTAVAVTAQPVTSATTAPQLRTRGQLRRLNIVFTHHKTARFTRSPVRIQVPESLAAVLTMYHDFVRPANGGPGGHGHLLLSATESKPLNACSVSTRFQTLQGHARVSWAIITLKQCRHVHADHCAKDLLELDTYAVLIDDARVMGSSREELRRSYAISYRNNAEQSSVARVQVWRQLLLGNDTGAAGGSGL